MENPQPENGHIDFANEIAEVLAKTQLSGYESRVLWVIWRKTWGWHKKEDWISNSQIVASTELKKSHISRTLKRLRERNIVTKNGNKWSFNKYYSQWLELPKLVTNKELPKMVSEVTKIGHKVTNLGEHKRNYTKETNTKEIVTKVTSTSYGNQDINLILKHLKETMEIPQLDLSEKVNRQYAWTLLKKSKKGAEGVMWLITKAAEDPWFKNHITSMRDLWNNQVKILAQARERNKSYVDATNVR